MNDEVKAAAERLRRLGNNLDNVPAVYGGRQFPHDAAMFDAAIVTSWALPLLDETPIDADWLRSVVHVTRTVSQNDSVMYLIDGKLELECYFERGWAVSLSSGVFILEQRTRGQFLQLCRSLGIELKASTANAT